MRSSIATLITVENKGLDSLGQMTTEEVRKDVPVTVKSITRYEWVESSKKGADPQTMLRTARINYEGEEIVEFEGNRLYIYRTFSDGDNIELYLERKAGI